MTRTIEALLFAVGSEGLSLEELTNILEKDADDVLKDLDKLNEKYKSEESGIELRLLGNSYKLTTKESEIEYLKKLAVETSNNLSEAALETLAIIAYNEPITRVQIDEIRGINSSQMIDENFICENCNKEVTKLGYTARDHCPYCLYSKHVDIFPGDRNNKCRGLLRPIGIEKFKDTYKIIYECTKCHEKHKNIMANDDNYDLIIELSKYE